MSWRITALAMISVVAALMTAFRCRSVALVFQVVATGELTVKQIVAGVELLLPEAAPVRPLSALRQGRSHVSWVLSSSLGRLVGKASLGEVTR